MCLWASLFRLFSLGQFAFFTIKELHSILLNTCPWSPNVILDFYYVTYLPEIIHQTCMNLSSSVSETLSDFFCHFYSTQFNHYLLTDYVQTTRQDPWATQNWMNIEPALSEFPTHNNSNNNWFLFNPDFLSGTLCIFPFNPHLRQPCDKSILMLPMRTLGFVESEQSI